MELSISKYHPTETFSRNGIDCVLCKIRNRLIKKTPEELIRQAFIEYLVIEKEIPLTKIEIEFPLSRVKKGDKKRADILVYGDDDNEKVILVVECKKGEWGLIDRDVEQAKYYNSVLKASCIVITNGNYHLTYKIFDNQYKQINVIPTFSALLKEHSLKKHIVHNSPYERKSLEELYLKETHELFIDWGHIGVDTKQEFYPFVANLVDLIFDKNSKFENLNFNGISILKDLGTVYDSFGNAAGGNWNGEYKKFLIRNKNGDHQTIGIGIFGSAKYENHPRFKNSKGYSYLVVSVDDYEKSHNSLQLNIDNNVKLINDVYYVNHNGKLTSGHKGSIRFDVVKNYLKKKAPHLVVAGDTIQLGVFPYKRLHTHTDMYSINFISNLIEYAILRDEIRRGAE